MVFEVLITSGPSKDSWAIIAPPVDHVRSLQFSPGFAVTTARRHNRCCRAVKRAKLRTQLRIPTPAGTKLRALHSRENAKALIRFGLTENETAVRPKAELVLSMAGISRTNGVGTLYLVMGKVNRARAAISTISMNIFYVPPAAVAAFDDVTIDFLLNCSSPIE